MINIKVVKEKTEYSVKFKGSDIEVLASRGKSPTKDELATAVFVLGRKVEREFAKKKVAV